VKYNPSIDFLRFISIVFVMFTHWGPHIIHNFFLDALLKISSDGRMGVDIFFVISGYLITYGLLNQKTENFSFVKELKVFYIKRTFRIFPIYYIFLIFLAIINFEGIRATFWWFFSYTSNILCFNDKHWNTFSHTWSLSVEEQFYLFWPLIVLSISSKNLKKFFFVIIFSSIIFSFWAENKYGYFASILLMNCLFILCSGSLLAYFVKFQKDRLDEKKTYLLVVGIVFFFLFIILRLSLLNNIPFFLLQTTQSIIHTVAAVSIMLFLINNPNIVAFKIPAYLGRISYGIYLYHYTTPSDLFFKHPVTHFEVFSNYFVRPIITFSLAIISYELLEKRLMQFARKKLLPKIA